MPARAGHRLPLRLDVPGPRAGLHARTAPRVVRVVLIVAFVLVTGAAGLAGRPARQVPPSGAEDYLAADGDRTLLTGPESTLVRWSAHEPGVRPFVDGPPSFVFAAIAAGDRAQAAAWVVESTDGADGSHLQLLRLDTDGLRTWAETRPAEWAFDPARLEVPARPGPGQRMTTTGTVTSVAGSADYTSTLEVLDAPGAGPGCLEFRRTDRIGDQPATTTSRTRCPGRGVVALDLPTGRWTATDAWPAEHDPRPGVELTEPPAGPLTGLRPHALTFERQDLPTQVAAIGPTQLLGERIMIPAQQSGNLLWIERADGNETTYRPGPWVGAGGDIIGSARCGEVTVVTTTHRRLLAHDGAGRWLWSTELADVAGARPVRSGEDLLVVTKDSILSAVGCRDGVVRWQTAEVPSTPAPEVGAAGILVGGERGVRLLDPVTGQTRWERDLPGPVTALDTAGERVVVGNGDGYLFALDPASGQLRAQSRLLENAAELRAVGDGIVARVPGRLIGLDQDLRQRWSQPAAALATVTDGDHLVAASLDELLVVDAAGAIVQRTPRTLHPASARIFLSRTPDGLLETDGFGTLVHWRAA
ncbi:MAG: PQQ-binding-like beta-propeller repeat protein [Propionibacteriaceae bacterium]|nr:PQQ-binding-like beta-propeller repeat protein [Propionibacteriaceae bacterium]